MKIKQYYFLVGILILAFALRIANLSLKDPHRIYAADGKAYSTIALNLLEGNGFLNTYSSIEVREPLYPLFLAGHYAIFGENYFFPRLTQALLNTVLVLLIFLMARQLMPSARFFPFAAAGFAALYPHFLTFSAYILTEINFTLLVFICIYFLSVWQGKVAWKRVAMLGLLIGLANLQRGTFLFFPLMLFFYFPFFYTLRKAFLKALLVLVFSILAISPWMFRNYLKYGQIIPASSHSGYILYMGNNPNSKPNVPHKSSRICYEPDFVEDMGKLPLIEANRHYQKRAIAYMVAHPVITLKNFLKKTQVFWQSTDGRTDLYKPMLLNSWLSSMENWLFKLMLAGMVLSLFFWKRFLPIYAVMIYFTGIHSILIIVGMGRFRLPLMPFIALFAAFTVSILADLIHYIVTRGWRVQNVREFLRSNM